MSLEMLGATFSETENTVSKSYAAAEEKAKAISAHVSPWLWVLSIGGFTLAIWNKAEISKMFGSWRKAKTILLK